MHPDFANVGNKQALSSYAYEIKCYFCYHSSGETFEVPQFRTDSRQLSKRSNEWKRKRNRCLIAGEGKWKETVLLLIKKLLRR
ncbi:hypothetical protein VNO77_41045 [Canavalia gladiata]|uniref:Uncharacterized protein n=1 Tax=Canavalia gladiata TaxID=3824 RepID=A0AAN9PRU8_CANGL